MEITYTSCPSHSYVDFLTDRLNQEAHPLQAITPFAFFIKEAKHESIIAGLNGFRIFGSLYIDQLWVDPIYRSQGLGRQLMEQVELLGRKEQCSMLTVATMSFLGAQKFYEKLGYVVEFIREGYVNQSSCIYLKKKL
ncbi:GNAT family N-acetyltransferase [Candidatus Cardinium hertigii]|uniref:N-acetyltransferase domain-containing protein n=1 Tax=Candidatus Cardinium hertigii TaxID=247481 RepID=A0A2Z3LHR8_9BACT|nr:GNAT family N-acetyltransferase [Candidatus Cardinium hertigii]AWN82055.1 hypothetical protein DK880_00746 [Candidatus Cardinium hertigii]